MADDFSQHSVDLAEVEHFDVILAVAECQLEERLFMLRLGYFKHSYFYYLFRSDES